MKARIRTAILLTSLIAGTAAYANPVITISDGVTSTGPITLNSDGSGTFTTASFDGSWSVVSVTGVSKPAIGSSNSPNLELNIQATSLGSANALVVTLSDDNFGPTTGNATAQFNGQAFGGAGTTVTFNTFYDTNNTLSAQTTALTASGPMSPNLYTSTETGSLSLTGPYSLTEVVTIPGNTAAGYSLLANLQVSNQPCTCTVSFTCPPNQMICANEPVPNPQTEASQIVATDTCLGAVPVSFLGATTNGICPSVITYTFGATSGCGQLSTCTQTITVNCLPSATMTTVSNTVAGTSNLMACVPNAGNGATYNWSITNGTITAGQDTPCITYTAGNSTSGPVVICVTVTTAAGCEASSCTSVPIVVCLPPDITTVTNTVAGTSNLMACVPNAGTGATYVWTISNGTITAGQDMPCITYTAGTNTSVPVVICVTVTTAAGCEASSCTSVPVTPPSCPCASHNIQYNFNGTQIIFHSTAGGSYVWFISDGKVSGLPNNQTVVLHISGQSITIPQTPPMTSSITFPVPDSFITFEPGATASATFDTVDNVWRMTFPPSGMAGNIFFGGVAFKVPTTGLPGGIKNVDWTGTFTTDTAGVNLNWQWHAANYTEFTSNYVAIAPKPTDDNKASIYQNSDLAGTPEGTDSASNNVPWKTFVVGGASGGGGANYTGSGSSTIGITPCVCPAP